MKEIKYDKFWFIVAFLVWIFLFYYATSSKPNPYRNYLPEDEYETLDKS